MIPQPHHKFQLGYLSLGKMEWVFCSLSGSITQTGENPECVAFGIVSCEPNISVLFCMLLLCMSLFLAFIIFLGGPQLWQAANIDIA